MINYFCVGLSNTRSFENNKIIDYADTEVEYDLLVTVPTNMGDPLLERSGLGDDLNYIPTNKTTLQSTDHKNIFAIGDATNVPASKAGSVAHFEAEILTDNILRYINKSIAIRNFLRYILQTSTYFAIGDVAHRVFSAVSARNSRFRFC